MSNNGIERNVWSALNKVMDPELPFISVVDLGIISKVVVTDEQDVTVTMTPTFTACPATPHIKKEIAHSLNELSDVSSSEVLVDFSEPWNSNKISESGRKLLKEHGFAPPAKHQGDVNIQLIENVNCPYCNSNNTSINSIFGSTLCRSTHYCHNCKQAFQQFKPI